MTYFGTLKICFKKVSRSLQNFMCGPLWYYSWLRLVLVTWHDLLVSVKTSPKWPNRQSFKLVEEIIQYFQNWLRYLWEYHGQGTIGKILYKKGLCKKEVYICLLVFFYFLDKALNVSLQCLHWEYWQTSVETTLLYRLKLKLWYNYSPCILNIYSRHHLCKHLLNLG